MGLAEARPSETLVDPRLLQMKLFCLLLPVLLSGCLVGRYSDGTTTFTVKSAFHKDALKGLVLSPKTGLRIQSAEGTSDAESLKALGDLLGRVAGIAAKTALAP